MQNFIYLEHSPIGGKDRNKSIRCLTLSPRIATYYQFNFYFWSSKLLIDQFLHRQLIEEWNIKYWLSKYFKKCYTLSSLDFLCAKWCWRFRKSKMDIMRESIRRMKPINPIMIAINFICFLNHKCFFPT